MKRVLKWLSVVLGVLLVLVLFAAAYVYIASEWTVRRTYDVPLSVIEVPTDSFAVLEGQRLGRIRGCFDGCHGQNMAGAVFFDEPGLARLVAPNLTQVAAQYSDSELERVIRQGVRRDSKSTIGMPSSMFYHLSDADLGAIIAFIRSAPLTDGPSTEITLGPLARIGIVLGQYHPQVAYIRGEGTRMNSPDASDQVGLGKYLAKTVCSECHGMNLRGSPDGSSPSLEIASAYPAQEFTRLMRTGIALGDRELPLMSSVARSRFSHFTDEEISALYAYLMTLNASEKDERDSA